MKSIAFIINPTTTNYKKFNKKIVKRFFEEGYIIKFYKTEYHKHSIELIKEIVKEKVDIVAVVSGTGTPHHILPYILKHDIKLALFPTGCVNGYAKYIGLPDQLDAFLQSLKTENTKQVDICEVKYNNIVKPYLSLCCIGASPRVAKKMEGVAVSNFLVYLKNIYNLLWGYKGEQPFAISTNNFSMESDFYEVMVANMPSFRGALTNKKYLSLSDGKMTVKIVDKLSYISLVKYGINMLLNGDDYLFSKIFDTKSVTINLKQKTLLQADFEPFEAEGEVVFSISSKKLNLIVPEGMKFI